jgi:glucan phosphorylase
MSPDLSLEFLMGRALDNAMLNVGMKDIARGGLSPKIEIICHESSLTSM